MEKWIHDIAASDIYYGVNDSAIEIFKKNNIERVVREAVQNSMDASNSEKPVIVEFHERKIKMHDFPAREDFLHKVRQSIELAKIKGDQNSIDVLQKIEKEFQNTQINNLIISDYNTFGLSKIKEGNGTFDALLNSEGFSFKQANSGGSFGFGKNAPFLLSSLRTVFYNTLNTQGETGFQGVSVLSSGLEGNDVSYPKKKYPQNPLDVNNIEIRKILKRENKFGTDIIIAGFDHPNWEFEAILAIVRNFFFAIKKKNLIVQVNKIKIDHKTIEDIVNKFYLKIKSPGNRYSSAHKEKIIESYYYVHLMNKEKKKKKIIFENDIMEFDLYMNFNTELNQKKVFGIRTIGMITHEFKYFTTSEKFIGFVHIKNEELNQILRKMENPTHDKWEVTRHPINEAQGRKLIKLIRDEIVAEVKKYKDSTRESIEISGLESLLKLSENEKKNNASVVRKKTKIPQKITLESDNTLKEKFYEDASDIYEQLQISKKKIEPLKLVNNNFKYMFKYDTLKAIYEFNLKALKGYKAILIEVFYYTEGSKRPCALKLIKSINSMDDKIIPLNKTNQIVIRSSEAKKYFLEMELQVIKGAILEVDIYEIK